MELLELPSDVEVQEDSSAGLSINDLGESGQVLTMVNVVNGANYSYVLENRESTRLLSPDESLPSVVGRSINASGVVVGSISTVDLSEHVFAIWEDGVGRILNEEFELPSGLTLSSVIKINDEGQILATATDADKALHALILRPT